MSWKVLLVTLAPALVPALGHAAPCEKPDATIWNAVATDTQLTACFGDDAAHHCLLLDLPAKAWTEAKPDALPPHDQRAAPKPTADAVTYTTNLRICATGAKDCHVLAVPGEASMASAQVVHNADRSLVAIVAFADTLPVFDGRTEKRLANIARLRSHPDDSFYGARFVGDMLVVFDQISPVSSSARLFNGRTGALLGKLAGGDEVAEDLFEDLGHDEYLFASFYGTSLYVQNLRTGRLAATLRLAPKRVDSLSVQPFVHITSDRARVIAMRGDAAGGVVVYDVARHHETRIPVPACK